MLLRLLKQDLRSTGRIMIVLYAAALVLAGISRLLSSFVDEAVGSVLILFFSRVISVLFFVAVAAVIVMTFVLMIIRFYKNYLTDEGYLMFTLPVTTGQLIWSKLLTSVLWVIVSTCVGVLAIFIITVGTDAHDVVFGIDFGRMLEGFSGGQSFSLILLVIVHALLSVAHTYLRCYASMAIGQSFGSHKLLLSVVFYIAFGIVGQILTLVLVNPLLKMDRLQEALMNAEPFNMMASVVGGVDVYYLLVCVFYFVITYLFFRKRLNLQ